MLIEKETGNVNRKKGVMFFVLISILLLLVLLSLETASAYVKSAPAYTFGYQTGDYTGGQLFPAFDREMCGAGQDFIVQVDPLGCTPSVVRSDLLEEQEVTVFCPLYATQLNPLIKVENINYMTISGDYPREVMTVGYYPARAALGKWTDNIATPIFDNIGYATIVLRKQPNETAMPDFVEGNLTANIRYNIDNAFGTGKAVYYLPFLTDEQFNNDYKAYAFWDGRGYLRLEGSDGKQATIGVYSDRDFSGTGRSGEKTRISALNLEEGGKPQEVFVPGFNYCMGGIKVQLNDLENPDERVRLRVDSDVLEIKKGDKFLENECTLKSISKQGLTSRTEISCRGDSGKTSAFQLSLSPKVKLMFDGEEHEYGIGERIPFSNDPNKFVYLGFIGTEKGTNKEEDLYVRFVQAPSNVYGEKLTDNMLSEVAKFDNDDMRANHGSLLKQALRWTSERLIDVAQWLERFAKYLVKGTEITDPLDIGKEETVYGTKVTLIGFAGPQNLEISGSGTDQIKADYTKAMEDYETIKTEFASERWPENDIQTMGEQALSEAIDLANHLGQRKTASDLCQEFSENYDSVIPLICSDESLLANEGISSQSVLINGKTHTISLEGIRKPSSEEYGAQIAITNAGNCSGGWTLGSEEETCLSDTESIKLVSVDEEIAEFDISNVQESTGRELFWQENKLKLKPGEFRVIGKNNYRISVDKINLQKVAKVTLDSQVDYAKTNASFNFRIGIEKRGIQLSPEKTTEKIESLNKTIEKWTKISDTLGKVVKTGKTACVAVVGALTLKNFFSNLGGAAIARQKVMRNEGGWYDKCQTMVNNHQYDSVEKCLLDNSDSINAAVDVYQTRMDTQNEEQKKLEQGISTTNFFGENNVDTDALAKRFIDDPEFISEISSCAGTGQITVGVEQVNVADIIENINSNTTSLTQARDLQLNCRLLNDPNAGTIAQEEFKSILGQIYSNSATERQIKDFAEKTGLDSDKTNFIAIKGSQGEAYKGLTYKDVKDKVTIAGISDDTPVASILTSEGKEYYAVLTKSGDNYAISQLYDLQGNPSSDKSDKLNIFFKTYDTTTYKNEYIDPRVRYYETDPYKGLPAVVPFDIQNGWYAAVKSTLPILGGLQAYSDSGRVSSFYVCNVGPNRREQFLGGDDICRGFVPKTGAAPDFSPLNPQESLAIMNKAERAIEDATKQYESAVRQKIITINNQKIDVGEPAANIPDIQCEDFMSPTDCNLMFNVCDPFVCPSSRCDLGGAYPVKDVVQSGIVGSLALCLPNWPEVKIPICVSGVNAGVEAWTSVLKSYQQCLQTSLDTGQTVGICDEINSVYTCEFVWRQGLPLIKYAVPKIIGNVLGQNVRGGGEYLGAQSAIDNVGKSFDYFTQYYADDSFRAFKARSAEGVGTEICKNWVSIAGPEGGNLLDTLTAPDSPSQFYGNFEEIPYTTATNPPASQYKVFYYIYAGKDFPAYYQVYLRGTGSSFYQDTDFPRPVASGFIAAGESKTETKDFTAPSGYKELCIVVNGQEECGFKQVTTEFGINYLSEQYVASQASQTDITSEAGCVSGSPSTYTLLNPVSIAQASSGITPESAIDETLNPAIYNRGIIRVCATNNPGQATNPSRWKDVGYCDNQNLRCWLDSSSVKDVIKNAYTEEQILGEVEDDYFAALKEEGKYIDDSAFTSLTKELKDLEVDKKNSEIITKVTDSIDKIFKNNQRALLLLIRGRAYGNLAKIGYDAIVGKAGPPELNEIIQNAQNEQEKLQTPNYPVLEFQDGTLFDKNVIYKYSGTQWYFSDDGQDWIPVSISLLQKDTTATPSDVTAVSSKFNSLSQKNKDFVKTLADKSYSEGLQLLIKRTIANDEGFLGKDVLLSTENVNFNPKNIFNSFSKGGASNIGLIYYKYDANTAKWQWAPDGVTWMVSPITTISGGNYKGYSISQTQVNLIKSLSAKNFGDGAQLIFGLDAKNFKLGGDGGSSTTTTIQTGECTDLQSCQTLLGQKIIDLAAAKKATKNILDSNVKSDTGAKSFECLVLQVAWIESRIRQCKGIEENENPLYCDGDLQETLGGDSSNSRGIMQINTVAHPDAVNIVADFDSNVNYGVDFLVSGYNPNKMTFTPTGKSYSGWARALRNYNGWGTGGNNNYVEDVVNARDEIAALFPECA